jgi:hypothetical protein
MTKKWCICIDIRKQLSHWIIWPAILVFTLLLSVEEFARVIHETNDSQFYSGHKMSYRANAAHASPLVYRTDAQSGSTQADLSSPQLACLTLKRPGQLPPPSTHRYAPRPLQWPFVAVRRSGPLLLMGDDEDDFSFPAHRAV